MSADLLARVEQRLGEVGARLNATSGGQALCRLNADATTAKELEGRMALLVELRRALRADPLADTRVIADRWAGDLASRRARGASQSWLAYLGGAVSESEVLGL